MTTRVQIPAYTDRWMMGDRYGVVVKVTHRQLEPRAPWHRPVEIAHVKLDKSGKTMKFVYADCTEV